jgi:transitional endoplasmic reticulum ATPase
MRELGISEGDIIEIVGKYSTVAIATYAEPLDETLSIIRIDGHTRKNAGVAVNEFATVKRANRTNAATVSVSAVGLKISGDKDFAEFVRDRMNGFPAVVGDEFSIIILGNAIAFKVQKTRPKGCVVINEETVLSIVPETIAGKRPGQLATYEEIGGLSEEVRRLREIVELPLKHPEIFQKLGIEAPNGILLYGPPGCGKTLLARALANECVASFYSINGPEIMNKYYGETEGKLRDLFKEAKENAPSIIFIDEIDALAPKREEAFGDVEKRVVAQLLSLMDGVSDRGDVVVIGATNRPESIDSALRRPGRFDRELQIGVPNPEGRFEILQIHTRGMPLEGDVNLEKLAGDLHGYTGADIRALCREAGLRALRRQIPDIDGSPSSVPANALQEMRVTERDFREALKEIVPTAMREFYSETPKVNWNEIGGLFELKRSMVENVIWAIKEPERFARVGVQPSKGLLLYGPPGCGKTLLAAAVATESGANLISVRGPEVLSKWLGESEKAVREIFKKARASSPCIVLFDEIDSIALSRSGLTPESDKVLSQLLTEIDNSGRGCDVFVIGATNRPDLVDVSLLRPGRLELLIYVPPPDEAARAEILRIHSQAMPLELGIPFEEYAARTRGYSGADLKSVCREAALEAMRRNSDAPSVTAKDFELALGKVKPMLSNELQNWFAGLDQRMQGKAKQSGFIG